MSVCPQALGKISNTVPPICYNLLRYERTWRTPSLKEATGYVGSEQRPEVYNMECKQFLLAHVTEFPSKLVISI
jgi:hypothetical protein